MTGKKSKSAPRTPAPRTPAPRKIETVVTWLEMTARPVLPPLTPPRGKIAFVRAAEPTVSFYRYLYDTVGGPWLWYERRAMTDEALLAVIRDPAVEIYVAWMDGVPAGWAELDRREAPVVDLAYFGMIPDFVGRGLGSCMLQWAIDAAWSGDNTTCLTVNTCTLDHPKALGLYQRAGFVPVRQEKRRFADPRASGLMPADSGQGL